VQIVRLYRRLVSASPRCTVRLGLGYGCVRVGFGIGRPVDWCVVVVLVGKLWTSPEILRENFPPPRGTQRGDVYSFSIICFEIMMRSEPYSFDHMTARGTYVTIILPLHRYSRRVMLGTSIRSCCLLNLISYL